MTQNQQLSEKELAGQNLQIIKAALDSAVKGSVFENMDTAFAAATAFNSIANMLLSKFQNENTNVNRGTDGSVADSTQD